MKTFVIACGGTGGHLSPGIAIAEELMSRGHKCILIISHKHVDQKLCAAYPQIPFIQFPGIGFSKKIYIWPKFFYLLGKNFIKALRLLKSIKADAVIGFGGFTNMGVMLAAAFLHKPCFLHEANQKVGKAIRTLGPIATKIYLPDGVFLKNVLAQKISYMGFPLRREIQKINKLVAREKLGINSKKKLIVFTGGSQGAKIFNQWVLENFESLFQYNINVICLTGVGNQKQVIERNTCKLSFMPFSQEMHILFSAADLVVSRAGAGTIAELTQCETPSILIPYPFAAENHQLANALAFEQSGGCLVLEQKQMYQLKDEIMRLLSETELLHDMSFNLHQLNQESATLMITNDIEKTLAGLKQKLKLGF